MGSGAATILSPCRSLYSVGASGSTTFLVPASRQALISGFHQRRLGCVMEQARLVFIFILILVKLQRQLQIITFNARFLCDRL